MENAWAGPARHLFLEPLREGLLDPIVVIVLLPRAVGDRHLLDGLFADVPELEPEDQVLLLADGVQPGADAGEQLRVLLGDGRLVIDGQARMIRPRPVVQGQVGGAVLLVDPDAHAHAQQGGPLVHVHRRYQDGRLDVVAATRGVRPDHGQQLEGVLGGRRRLTRGRKAEQQHEGKGQVAWHGGGVEPR